MVKRLILFIWRRRVPMKNLVQKQILRLTHPNCTVSPEVPCKHTVDNDSVMYDDCTSSIALGGADLTATSLSPMCSGHWTGAVYRNP